MDNKLYINYVAGGVKDLDILMTYRLTEDEKVEVVHCMYGDEAKLMLGMIVPATIVMNLELGTYYIEHVQGTMLDSKLFVYSKTGVHNPPLNIIKGTKALYVYRTLTGAPDNIRDMWPGTIIRETHNPYMDKNYFVPARHCGRSAAMMMVDELDDYFKKTKIPKMYIKHEPKFTLENCLGNEVRHYIEEDVKATTELFNNIYNGRAVSFGALPQIERVLFNDPATIVFWKDGTKTVVKAQGDDEFDPEKGLAMAICKKALGNNRDYYEIFKKHVGRYEKQQRKEIEMIKKLGECAGAGILDGLAEGTKRFAEAAKQVAPHMPGDRHDS